MFKLTRWRLLTFIVGALLFGAEASAQTITAASCSKAAVQTALNSVTASTTTVNIPSGTCDWTSQVVFTVPSGNTNLSILGAGNLNVNGGGDATVIVDNDTTDSNYLLQVVTAAASSYFRMAGITFDGGTGGVKNNGVINFGGDSQSFRFDHNHINALTAGNGPDMVIRVNGWIYGVFDHNIFDSSAAQGVLAGVEVWYDGYNNDSLGDGDQSWAASSNFGTNQAIFIENNTFNYSGYGAQSNGYIDDCYAGGRIVIRYNTINNSGIQTHPTGGAGRIRGCRTEEIYGNTFNGSNSAPTFTAFWDSSGPALIWGNSAPTGYEDFIDMHSMRRDNSTYTQTATPNGWGYCGMSFNGTGSAWDENTITSTGYACLDQPGQGQSDLLSGDFPNAVDTATSTMTWPHQKLEPVYEWLDTWTQVSGYPRSEIDVSDSAVLAANRDYYQYTATFNGTSGTGSGLLSARPATCTPLVAYWATDTQTLYQCTTTNTWSVYYKPYVYPHPLDVTSSATAPAPPANPVAVAY